MKIRAVREILISVLLLSLVSPAFSAQKKSWLPEGGLSACNGVIEDYEKKKGMEKYDVRIVIDIKWTDNANYTEYQNGDVYQTVWDLKYRGYGMAVSRLYRMPRAMFMVPARIEVAPARFTLKPASIAAVCYYISKESYTKSNDVKQLIKQADSIVAGPGIQQPHGEEFTLDFTLSAGVIAPMNFNYPMTMMTPFMTHIDPKKIMDASKMSAQQFMDTFRTSMEGTFKIPISTDFINFDDLKSKKTIMVHMRDEKEGPGIRGMGEKTKGRQHCSYEADVYLTIGPADSMVRYTEPGMRADPARMAKEGPETPEPPKSPTPPAPPTPPTTPPPGKDKPGPTGGSGAPDKDAGTFTDRMIQYYKSGHYAGIYAEMTDSTRATMTLDQWIDKCKSQKQKLGELSRYHRSALYSDSINPGDATEVEYHGEFVRAEGVITVSAIKDSGRWKARAFVVRSDALRGG